MHLFNPKTNPWAAELLRLASAVFPALGDGERHLVAALYAAKLYDRHVSRISYHAEFNDNGRWVFAGEYLGGRPVNLVVLLNERWGRQVSLPGLDRDHHMILLHVGNGRVAELFNGPGELAPQHPRDIDKLLHELRQREPKDFPEWRGEGLRPASDRALQERFPEQRPGPADDAGGRPPGGDGGGNDRRGPGGPGGPGGGGSDDGNGDGTGGLTEYLNHPVMLGVDARLYDEILGQT